MGAPLPLRSTSSRRQPVPVRSCLTHDSFSDAPEHKMLESGTPVGSHHENIRLKFTRGLQDVTNHIADVGPSFWWLTLASFYCAISPHLALAAFCSSS